MACTGREFCIVRTKNLKHLQREELAALKYGMCSLMEAVMKLENAEQQALAGNSSSANVKSRSSGGESVSYESRKTAYDEALTSSTKREELFGMLLWNICSHAYSGIIHFMQEAGD